MFVTLGVNKGDKFGEFNEDDYANRIVVGVDKERRGLIIFEPDLKAGTDVQLMQRSIDFGYVRERTEGVLRRLGSRTPFFALYIDCAARGSAYSGTDGEDKVMNMKYLDEFAHNVWLVNGPIVRDMGAFFTTRMTIVKLSDGSIWTSSPVPVSFAALEEISELGDIRYLVAATPRHVWRLAAWHNLFPEAELWVSRPTLFTLQKGRLPISGYLGDEPVKAWNADFDQLEFRGNFLLSEVLFLHKSTHTVILDDLVQRNPTMKDKPLTNLIFKLGGVQYPDGGVGIDMRMTFFDRNLARRSLEKLLSWDFDRLIIAHGACIEAGAKQYVKRAFSWLEK